METKRFLIIEDYLRNYLSDLHDPLHGWDHADRVRQNASQIIELLQPSDIDHNLLQTVCLIHDVHYTMYRYPRIIAYWFENALAKRAASRLLRQLPVNDAEAIVIIHAVAHHARSFPFRELHPDQDIYTKILQDADTLDFFNRHRIDQFKQQSSSAKLLSPVVDETLDYGREHIGTYLNFPEVASLLKSTG